MWKQDDTEIPVGVIYCGSDTLYQWHGDLP